MPRSVALTFMRTHTRSHHQEDATLNKENVWDYPRPAVCEPFKGHVRIEHHGKVIADSSRAYRVLETSHPPTYYIPPQDIALEHLVQTDRVTQCEWKGRARYFDLVGLGDSVAQVGWRYSRPTPTFIAMTDFISFYASKLDRCLVNDEVVQAQEGDFYGGWITSNIEGPFKGAPGTWGW